MKPTDDVTIVLITHNCERWVNRTLESLCELDIPVIAVDNASADRTRDIVRRFSPVELIELEDNIGAAARNVGADRARTRYVAFCDDDGWYELAGLETAVSFLDRFHSLALVNARILVGEQERLDPISAEMEQSPLRDDAGIPGKVLLGFMAGACVVRRDAYLSVGGYDPRFFIGGEEETLAYKLVRRGWQMRYVNEMVVHHFPSGVNAPKIRHYGVRNTLINAWLHRPASSAWSWTKFIVRTTPGYWNLLRGVVMTIAAIPWIVRERSAIPGELESQFAILEQRRRAATTGRARHAQSVW